MTPEVAIEIVREGLYLILLMVTVIITPSFIVGLMVSVFQAATQINEQTLSFLPRLLVTLTVIIVMGPWMAQRLLEYFERLIEKQIVHPVLNSEEILSFIEQSDHIKTVNAHYFAETDPAIATSALKAILTQAKK